MVDLGKLGGAPCIRGYRLSVASLLRMLGNGWTRTQILSEWHWMEEADIDEALRYAARVH